jgi:signal peptidase I
VATSSLAATRTRQAAARVGGDSRRVVLVLLLAVLLVLVLREQVAVPVRVTSSSMLPTLAAGDVVLLRHGVAPGEVGRGDVVRFSSPTGSGPALKRVVGVAGDSVVVLDSVLHLDGVPVPEPYVTTPPSTATTAAPSRCLPARCSSSVTTGATRRTPATTVPSGWTPWTAKWSCGCGRWSGSVARDRARPSRDPPPARRDRAQGTSPRTGDASWDGRSGAVPGAAVPGSADPPDTERIRAAGPARRCAVGGLMLVAALLLGGGRPAPAIPGLPDPAGRPAGGCPCSAWPGGRGGGDGRPAADRRRPGRRTA